MSDTGDARAKGATDVSSGSDTESRVAEEILRSLFSEARGEPVFDWGPCERVDEDRTSPTGDYALTSSTDEEEHKQIEGKKNMKPTGPANTSPTAAGIQEIMGRGRRASREAEGACGKKARSGSPKHRSLSPNFWGKGKPPLAAMRNDHRFHCRGVAEPSGYDEEKYSGVVTVDIRGRFDPLNAIGTSVAKTFPSRDDGPTLMPGRVVGQKSLKGRSTGVKYRVIYLNGVEEELNEDALRRYSALFSNASMYNEAPLKPIIVRMM